MVFRAQKFLNKWGMVSSFALAGLLLTTSAIAAESSDIDKFAKENEKMPNNEQQLADSKKPSETEVDSFLDEIDSQIKKGYIVDAKYEQPNPKNKLKKSELAAIKQTDKNFTELNKSIEEQHGKDKPVKFSVDRGTFNSPFPEQDPNDTQASINQKMKDGDDYFGVKVNKKNEEFGKLMEDARFALQSGMNEVAVELYKLAVEYQPNNKNALLGLATAYQMNNQYDQSRIYYTKLLKKDSSNKIALNNYLILLSNSSPDEAIKEFQKLSSKYSDFSMLTAQMGMIQLRKENYEEATKFLLKAVMLAPNNINYKYNLAIAYDRLGNKMEAIRFYREVTEAARNGAAIPDSIDTVQNRMIYLASKN